MRKQPPASELILVNTRGINQMEFDRISIDPEICRGRATVRGTRITVEFVLKLLGNGYGARDIVREYPGLTFSDIAECASYGSWLASESSSAFQLIEPVRDTFEH